MHHLSGPNSGLETCKSGCSTRLKTCLFFCCLQLRKSFHFCCCTVTFTLLIFPFALFFIDLIDLLNGCDFIACFKLSLSFFFACVKHMWNSLCVSEMLCFVSEVSPGSCTSHKSKCRAETRENNSRIRLDLINIAEQPGSQSGRALATVWLRVVPPSHQLHLKTCSQKVVIHT